MKGTNKGHHKGKRINISICHIQYIIDHKHETPMDISAKLDVGHTTVKKLLSELGIQKGRNGTVIKKKKRRMMMRRDRPTPKELARWNNYDPKWLALALEWYGYGDMKYTKVLNLCKGAKEI